MVAGKCTTAVNPGATQQALSRLTGGLRFPVCDPAKYDTVFKTVAQGVVLGAQISCEFDVPQPPPGYNISNRIYVEYTPGSAGAAELFRQVGSSAVCSGKTFYVESGKVLLCPDACGTVKADSAAQVKVFFTCEGAIG
jgi:hypothetical protein